MRIYSLAVSKWNETKQRYALVESESVWREYDGPIAMAKGSASKAEQSAADQQRQLEDQIAQQQLSLMQQQLQGVNAVVDPAIAAGGFFPGQEAAMTSLVTNNLANTYRQGIGQINSNLVARGLSGGQTGAGGGGVAGQYGAMLAALGNAQQQGLSQIQLDKASQMQGLLGLKLGIGSQYGGQSLGYNQGAGQALGAGVTAAGNADQASSSFLGPLFGAIGGLGGSAITKWCVVASECYGGWDVPRVRFIRARLTLRAMNDWRWTLLMTGYTLAGARIAAMVRKSAWVKSIATRLFDKFVSSELDAVLNQAVQEFEL